MLPVRARVSLLFFVPFAAVQAACAGAGETGPSSVRLIDAFESAVVSGTPAVAAAEPAVWTSRQGQYLAMARPTSCSEPAYCGTSTAWH